MVLEIPKSTPEKKVREILNRKNINQSPAVKAFFGKLPHLEDGLKIQKRLRGEWK